MRIQLVTAPIEEAVTELEFKQHAVLPIGFTGDDAYIRHILAVARRQVEDWTARRLVDSTYDLWIDGWPAGDEIVIPFPPLIWTVADSYVSYIHSPSTSAIGVVTYTTTTWPTTEYLVDTDSEPGRIVLNYGKQYPTTTLRPYNPIQIRFDCGWADTDDIPEELKQGILLMATDMFEIRQDTIIGGVKELTLKRARNLIDGQCRDWL